LEVVSVLVQRVTLYTLSFLHYVVVVASTDKKRGADDTTKNRSWWYLSRLVSRIGMNI
jgi:hypothetical protein